MSDQVTLKRCCDKSCQQVNPQPIASFGRDSGKVDGLDVKCKFCRATYQAGDGREKKLERNRRYRESKNGAKANQQAYKNQKQRRKLNSLSQRDSRTCPTCQEVFFARGKRIYCNADCYRNRRSADRFLIFSRDSFRCIYCGRSSIEEGVTLHIDHIIPASRGGLDIAMNLGSACFDCNIGKSASMLSENSLNRLTLLIEKRNVQAGINGRRVIKL